MLGADPGGGHRGKLLMDLTPHPQSTRPTFIPSEIMFYEKEHI